MKEMHVPPSTGNQIRLITNANREQVDGVGLDHLRARRYQAGHRPQRGGVRRTRGGAKHLAGAHGRAHGWCRAAIRRQASGVLAQMARERGKSRRAGVFIDRAAHPTRPHLTKRSERSRVSRMRMVGHPIGTLGPASRNAAADAFPGGLRERQIEVLSPALHRGLVECLPAPDSQTSTRTISVSRSRLSARRVGSTAVAVTVEAT